MSTRVAGLAAVLLAAACGPTTSTSREVGACTALLPGDLVISEVLANPAGDDSGNEWWELYNASGTALPLTGVVLETSDPDGAGRKRTTLAGGSLAAGTYLVVGNVDPEAKPAHVDHAYGAALGDLRNAAGRLAVRCGDTLVDEALYVDAPDGASLGFDGAQVPDGILNEDLANWCAATAGEVAGSLGTPGATNEICPGAPGAGLQRFCAMADGTTRPVVAPGAGDLVFNEVMADPSAVADDAGEWLEIAVRADVDLNGIVLGKRAEEVEQQFNDAFCLEASAGEFLLLARSDDAATNGGLGTVDAVLAFSLGNAGGPLYLGRGELEIDAVEVPPGAAGRSVALDPAHLNVVANDLAANWCRTALERSYGAGDHGTPRAANDPCPVTLVAGFCLADGEPRAIRGPGAGDLVITEFMADPAAVGDPDGEWIEVYASASFDLNGLQLGKVTGEVDETIANDECLPVAAGDHAVLAKEADALRNGDLPRVDAVHGLSMGNSGFQVLWVGHSDTLLDTVTYVGVTSGRSRSLDPDARGTTTNDDRGNWCDGDAPFGDGDRGTPGSANEACPRVVPDGFCLDDGSLRAVDAAGPGELVITEFMADPAAVADGLGEWLEVSATAALDLNGLQLGREDGVKHTIDDEVCLPVAAGELLILAPSDDAGQNGGLDGVDALVGSLSLGNATSSFDAIVLSVAGTTIDEVTYTTARAGAATSLDPDYATAAHNDDEDRWCAAVEPYGDGDLGTPGAFNPACPLMVPAGFCRDGATVRAVAGPAVGDLVVSEIMANPAATSDTGGEWLELAVVADADRDLNGVVVANAADESDLVLGGEACWTVSPGDLILLARGDDPALNGGLPAVDALLPSGLVLGNSGGAVWLGFDGATIDEVTYTAAPAGVAISLDADQHDAVANNAPGNWCDAVLAYGDGDLGTPGAANPGCEQCVDPGSGLVRDPVAPAPGDLAIVELLADPAAVGNDEGEWLELDARAAVDLNGLAVTTSVGVTATVAGPMCVAADAGALSVLVVDDDPERNGGIPTTAAVLDFGALAVGVGALAQPAGSVWLRHAGALVDVAHYHRSLAGFARSLTPTVDPVDANDVPNNWCHATDAFGAGDRGTPGTANPRCPATLPAPGAGELVLSEWLPNPAGSDGDGGEYIEFYNRSPTVSYDLIGCTLSDDDDATTVAERTVVGPEARVVFGRPEAGGFSPDVTVDAGFVLVSSGTETLTLVCGAVVVDRVVADFGGAFPTAADGVALNLDLDDHDADANDDGANWCAATSDVGDPDGLGTPGFANDDCAEPPPPAGTCYDGPATRAIVAPAVGELVITEIMANPTTDEPGGEWFELYVTSAVTSLDLNGVGLGDDWSTGGTTDSTIGDGVTECVAVAGGSYLVLARSDGPENNGLPAVDVVYDSLGLGNGGDELFVARADGVLIDRVAWSRDAGNGQARQLDHAARATAAADDADAYAWCDATNDFNGLGDLGTPGAANGTCAPPPPPPPPAGYCYDGPATRAIDYPRVGELVIAEVHANPNGSESTREWFEVVVTATAGSLDLNGLSVGENWPADATAHTVVNDECLPVAGGTHLVFAASSVASSNGNLPRVDVDYNGITMTNGGDGLFLALAGGVLLDAVRWSSPASNGVAKQLESASTGTATNDDLATAAWCDATTAYGDGDLGTPGAANVDVCP